MSKRHVGGLCACCLRLRLVGNNNFINNVSPVSSKALHYFVRFLNALLWKCFRAKISVLLLWNISPFQVYVPFAKKILSVWQRVFGLAFDNVCLWFLKGPLMCTSHVSPACKPGVLKSTCMRPTWPHRAPKQRAACWRCNFFTLCSLIAWLSGSPTRLPVGISWTHCMALGILDFDWSVVALWQKCA